MGEFSAVLVLVLMSVFQTGKLTPVFA